MNIVEWLKKLLEKDPADEPMIRHLLASHNHDSLASVLLARAGSYMRPEDISQELKVGGVAGIPIVLDKCNKAMELQELALKVRQELPKIWMSQGS